MTRSARTAARSRRPSPFVPPAWRGILIALATAAGLWLLYRLEHVVVLLVLTTFFAYLIEPLVRFAERPVRLGRASRRLPRGLAIGLVYFCLVMVGGVVVGALIPKLTLQIGDAVAQAPEYTASLRAWEQRWVRYYDQAGVPVEVRQGIDRGLLGAGDADRVRPWLPHDADGDVLGPSTAR